MGQRKWPSTSRISTSLLDSVRIQDIWSTQRRHLSCIEDRAGVQLYTETASAKYFQAPGNTCQSRRNSELSSLPDTRTASESKDWTLTVSLLTSCAVEQWMVGHRLRKL